MVNKENIRKWVAALRSGDYKQGFSRLETPVVVEGEVVERHQCCLGVACRVFMVENPNMLVAEDMIEDNRVRFRNTEDTDDYDTGVLPSIVSDWLGLGLHNPYLNIPNNPDAKLTASSLNDSGKYNFDAIADAIERTYLSD